MTPTATPTPIINGHVTWDGLQQWPELGQQIPITLTLRPAGGGPYINYPALATDHNGFFMVVVDGLPSGDYNWWAKGNLHLANSGTITLISAPVTELEIGMMRAGDANGDNVVNVLDFNIVKGTFGRECENPDYDERGDFNGDCVVNINDFNLQKSNFGRSGAPRSP